MNTNTSMIIHTYVYDMFSIWNCSIGLGEEGEGGKEGEEKNDSE
jgi:hypothetical protein